MGQNLLCSIMTNPSFLTCWYMWKKNPICAVLWQIKVLSCCLPLGGSGLGRVWGGVFSQITGGSRTWRFCWKIARNKKVLLRIRIIIKVYMKGKVTCLTYKIQTLLCILYSGCLVTFFILQNTLHSILSQRVPVLLSRLTRFSVLMMNLSTLCCLILNILEPLPFIRVSSSSITSLGVLILVPRSNSVASVSSSSENV